MRTGAEENFSCPTLLYGCEIWTLKQRDIRRIKTAEMKFMKHTAGYTFRPQKKLK